MTIINSFVAVFDFLGFKASREARGTEGLFQLYERTLLPSIQHAAAGRGKVSWNEFVPDPGPMSLTSMIFSDTIVLIPGGCDFGCFCRILRASTDLLAKSFCGHKAVLRGGIGYGDLVVNDYNVLLGSAVEDAHECQAAQAWAGCSFSKKCEEFIQTSSFIPTFEAQIRTLAQQEINESKRRRIESELRRIVRYDIPIYHNPKSGPVVYSSISGLAINWTLYTYEGASNKGMQASSDPHALNIIANTQAFENWARNSDR